MKVKRLLFVLVAVQVVGTVQLNASEKLPQVITQQEQVLVVKQDELYGEKVVKVCFNGENMGTGKLSVTDSKGSVVYYSEEFDLVAAPNFNAIALSQLSTGELTFTLVTKIGTYKTTITL